MSTVLFKFVLLFILNFYSFIKETLLKILIIYSKALLNNVIYTNNIVQSKHTE